MQLSLNDFKQYMIASGKSEHTATLYAQRMTGFLSTSPNKGLRKSPKIRRSLILPGSKTKNKAWQGNCGPSISSASGRSSYDNFDRALPRAASILQIPEP